MWHRAKGVGQRDGAETGITENNFHPPEGLGWVRMGHEAWSIQPGVENIPCLSYYLSIFYKIKSDCGRRIFVINMILSIFDTSK
jgi:hypothetical protein